MRKLSNRLITKIKKSILEEIKKMKKLRRILVSGGAVAACAISVLPLTGCGGSQPGQSSTSKTAGEAKSKRENFKVTDMLGREVEIPGNARSFACIAAGSLRYYSYVADKSQLAGIEDVEKIWNPEGRPYVAALGDISGLKSIGKGGPQAKANADALIEAAPDVIFSMYNTNKQEAEDLQSKTKIPVVVLSYGKDVVFSEDTYKSLELIGKITDHEKRAEEVISYLKNTESDLKKRVANVSEKPKAYLGALSYKGIKGITGTAGKYMPFDVIGVKNVAADAGLKGPYADMDKEALIQHNPDNIFVDAEGLAVVKKDFQENPDFYKSLKAVQEGRVYSQLPFHNYYTNIEMAIGDAYYIGTVLYPEQFKDIDPGSKYDEVSEKLLGVKTYEKTSKKYGPYNKIDLSK